MNKKKKDKNVITINRDLWRFMKYGILPDKKKTEVICNHSRIDPYTDRCEICDKPLVDINFEKILKKKKREDKNNE